ncbi:uncharacterized protein LOC114396990 [Glycine soja]|uniref:uncharacterized protein LOC114396990 n=1 Tax=Glycine soja TaxID=3848 RepID=UPI0010397625|nr:uncharacterized protein LOC114396990 [Glycine soja]
MELGVGTPIKVDSNTLKVEHGHFAHYKGLYIICVGCGYYGHLERNCVKCTAQHESPNKNRPSPSSTKDPPMTSPSKTNVKGQEDVKVINVGDNVHGDWLVLPRRKKPRNKGVNEKVYDHINPFKVMGSIHARSKDIQRKNITIIEGKGSIPMKFQRNPNPIVVVQKRRRYCHNNMSRASKLPPTKVEAKSSPPKSPNSQLRNGKGMQWFLSSTTFERSTTSSSTRAGTTPPFRSPSPRFCRHFRLRPMLFLLALTRSMTFPCLSILLTSCYLDSVQRGGLFVALLEITGGKASIQVNGKTYRKNSRLILSGGDERSDILYDSCVGSEIYQETLCKALAKHFGARLLIVDCLSLPGVCFFSTSVQIFLCFYHSPLFTVLCVFMVFLWCIAHSYSKGVSISVMQTFIFLSYSGKLRFYSSSILIRGPSYGSRGKVLLAFEDNRSSKIGVRFDKSIPDGNDLGGLCEDDRRFFCSGNSVDDSGGDDANKFFFTGPKDASIPEEMTLKQLGRLFPNKVTIQLPQDEALLSDWKQQLERDIETMKVQSNIVSVCTVSPKTSDSFYVPFLLLLSYASSYCIFSACFYFFHLLCISVICLWNMWNLMHWLCEIFLTALRNAQCHFRSCFCG